MSNNNDLSNLLIKIVMIHQLAGHPFKIVTFKYFLLLLLGRKDKSGGKNNFQQPILSSIVSLF